MIKFSTPEKDVSQAFLQRLMALDYRHLQSVSVPESVSTDDDDFNALFSTNVDSSQSKQDHVHPMDVQMVVFHCSDSFLKQNMITKLSQCQYALPLLVPDPAAADIECPLWTFRQIRKTWKKTEIKDNSKTISIKSLPICKAETPLVSFFRLGSLSQSKSQLMNTLINDRHNTFFHRNCPRSTKSRHLMDGVVEIAWYCPAGKDNDSFSDCIGFCNLHGDSLLMEKQREILTEISSVLVVLVPALEKGQESSEVISTLFRTPNLLIVLTADNDCGAVQIKPQKYKVGLKDRSQSDVSEELREIIRKILSGSNKSFNLELMSNISGVRVDEDDTVCQNGKSAAMNIVKTNKERFHLRGNIEKEKSQKDQQLIQIRQKQCAASCSELMKSFTHSLMSLEQKDKEYFLKWTQILIDELSSKNLSLKVKQTELEQISQKLQAATFGLEHIFREMSQIYEAHQSLKRQTHCRHTEWVKYPELAADLMISGHPMELMDGDAGHVPLTWISGLLQEVIKKLGDQRVFVLSILGVQSSGKSTMLNAMFGLQFAVSAGRCTKGAYMQLLKLSEEIKTDFKFDYVLVVDTEGLRALELEGHNTLHHDNELATFVVGLGNMTLINIFGENPAEMQDILQIVVQAFMRMKEVQLSPSCVFVHQNVTDVTAAEKNMDGKRRLQEKLDKMAQLAAKEEGSDAECFSDVIAFDVQKDVKYFTQLWEGSPPMAPPNPGYSESVQELKSFILSKASESHGIKLSHFSSKIQDLWNALLNENFVFSFKNTQEISVYRKLEVQYGNWTWTLRSEMLTIENRLYPQIENGILVKIEFSDLSKEISKTYEQIKTEITDYFEKDADKEMLVQWRGRFQIKITDFHEELVTGVKRKLDEVIQQKKACKKLDEKKTDFENKLLQKSKELAHNLKETMKDEEELKMQFDSVWSHWVKELTSDTKPIEDINLEEDQLTTYKNLTEIGNYEEIRSFIRNVEHKSLEIIQKFESNTKITFKKEFTVELLLFVFHKGTSWILQSHKTYKYNNDALTYLNSKKNEYFNIFRSFCKGSSSPVMFGELICEKLKVSAVEAVCNQTAVDLAGELRCNFPAFNGNRLNLEKHVLKDLAEKEDFYKFVTYIRDPRKQVEEFIREKVKMYMSVENKNKTLEILQKNAENILKVISQTLFEATEKIKTKKGDINMWVKEFSSSLSCKLRLDTISCQNFRDINSFDFLRDEIEKGLQIISKEMKDLSLVEVMNHRLKPDEILIDQLCNCCWERCPFCGAVCTNTIKDHSPDKHSVPFHRPSGVNGWHIRGTVELITDFCTTLVTSDKSFYPSRDSEKSIPYKQYPTAGGKYATWSITVDGSMEPYWKWFVCRFQKKIEDRYKENCKEKCKGWGGIPFEWRNYSKEEALKSLDEICKKIGNIQEV
uniref:VLIG-type G domain-containing protein n=1 Tax=Oryzias melastigma TaxID=30732 RepID=A0A3B3BIV1_ORYME